MFVKNGERGSRLSPVEFCCVIGYSQYTQITAKAASSEPLSWPVRPRNGSRCLELRCSMAMDLSQSPWTPPLAYRLAPGICHLCEVAGMPRESTASGTHRTGFCKHRYTVEWSVKEPNKLHNYETQKITRKASDAAEYIELFGSSIRDRHAWRI